MMKKIDPQYYGQRSRFPLVSGCVLWLMLDRLQATGVTCGVAWTIYASLALCLLIGPFNEKWVHPKDV
jgi:hypothetical protein